MNESFFKIFIYFWLRWVFIAACRLSLVAASRGYSSLRLRGLLTVVASLVSEHGLQQLWLVGSVVVARGL